MSETVRLRRDGALAWIELNRPEKRNALDRAALLALLEALRTATSGPETRVILLTGTGDRAFSAGADVGEMHGLDAEGIRSFIELGKEVARSIEEAPVPVLAVVNGYALGGGCELVLACDLILAADTAEFALPEVDLALLPGWGGTQRLERRVGYGRAREMILTGRRVGAAEALSWGLCDRVAPAERLREEAAALAGQLAAKDPAALAAAREALRLRATRPPADALARETELFVELFARPARAEATGRFARRGER